MNFLIKPGALTRERTLAVNAQAGYVPEIGRWLWAMNEVRRRTLRLVDALDQRVLDWEGPDGRENAIGTLLYHIALVEMSWLFMDGARVPDQLTESACPSPLRFFRRTSLAELNLGRNLGVHQRRPSFGENHLAGDPPSILGAEETWHVILRPTRADRIDRDITRTTFRYNDSRGAETMDVVNLTHKLEQFSDYWSPKIIADVNDMQVKLVKFTGEFVWHHHEKEDELFFVIQGRLRMRFRSGDRMLGPGELIVVPRGVEHCPVSESGEVHVMLLEPKTTLNTGNVRNERTVPVLERI